MVARFLLFVLASGYHFGNLVSMMDPEDMAAAQAYRERTRQFASQADLDAFVEAYISCVRKLDELDDANERSGQ